jgi:hypothetical protein
MLELQLLACTYDEADRAITLSPILGVLSAAAAAGDEPRHAIKVMASVRMRILHLTICLTKSAICQTCTHFGEHSSSIY